MWFHFSTIELLVFLFKYNCTADGTSSLKVVVVAVVVDTEKKIDNNFLFALFQRIQSQLNAVNRHYNWILSW